MRAAPPRGAGAHGRDGLTGAEVMAAFLAVVDRLPLLGSAVRMVRGGHPEALLDVRAARGSNGRPGLVVTVTNPGPSDLYLAAVGLIVAGRDPYANPVGCRLAVGEAPHSEWLDLSDLAIRTGLQDPVTPITHVFAQTSVGTARLRVDALRLSEELEYLYPPDRRS